MHETTLLKALGIAAILTELGLYKGAAIIAFIAAASRLSYTAEKATFWLFGRFFFMSLSITMLMVHIGKANEFSNDIVIIISGITAFLCREVLELVVKSKDSIWSKITKGIKF